MNQDYESKYHLFEQNHWWFKARRDAILRFVLKHPKTSRILEVGCSGGQVIKDLQKAGFNATGIDISYSAITECRKSGLNNTFVMDATKLRFKQASFDILIASDVLEHINDDTKALREWKRVLSNNGTLIVFVPALKILWSTHDEQNHHFRRYAKSMLNISLKQAGFEVIRISYWNATTFLPVLLMRLIKKIIKTRTKDDLGKINRFTNKILIYILRQENKLLQFVNLPVGVSVFAVARKRN